MECKNLIESGTIDLQKGCPVCGGKKFQYIRLRPTTPPDPKQTVSEYVESAALREPQFEAKESPVSSRPGKVPVSDEPMRPIKELALAKRQEAGRPEPPKPVKKLAPEDKLGDRVESIRIVDNGTYDINLPLLLSRKEFVTSREEGSYTVDLNSALKPAKPGKVKKKKK
jgi:predicted  nucleic acid-binding Zn-ribbon protein